MVGIEGWIGVCGAGRGEEAERQLVQACKVPRRSRQTWKPASERIARTEALKGS